MPAIEQMDPITNPLLRRYNKLDLRIVRDPQWKSKENERGGLTPSALGFIIPIIIVFIIGPIIAILSVRLRRRRNAHARVALAQPVAVAASRSKKIPPIGRDLAILRLNGATDVVKTKKDEVYKYEVTITDKEKDIEIASTVERDCAICLSALYSPSYPSPAKLVDANKAHPCSTDPTLPNSASTYSNFISYAEEILRLKTCAHEFHAECLISWCALSKVSCPICRAVYYENPKVEEEDMEAAETVRIERVEEHVSGARAGRG